MSDTNRLNEALKVLAAEAHAVTPRSEPGEALLAEFSKRFEPPRVVTMPPPRRLPWWAAAGAVAATLIAGWAGWSGWHGSAAPKKPEMKPQPVETANVLMPPKGGPAPQVKVQAQAGKPARVHKPARPAAVTPEPVQSAAVETADSDAQFIPIPWVAPLAPYERADVVRMDLPVSALIAAGLPFHGSDPGARARADLVVGEDGRARAVRLISISDSSPNSYRSIR